MGSYILGLRPNSTQKQHMKDRRQVIVFSSSTLNWKMKKIIIILILTKLKGSNELKSLKVFHNYIKAFHKLVSHIHILQISISKVRSNSHQNFTFGTSLVAQWLRICLPMQGTWVRALVWEDPTCRGATGPVSHNY